MALAAPEIDVKKSRPVIESKIARIKNINKKENIKTMTDVMKSSDIF